MSPPAATIASREAHRRAAARRRRVARRRLRGVVLVAGLCGVVAAVVIAAPMFQKAVNEFTLPLAYQDVIREQAADKHLDPALIAAVIYAETKFDPRTSSAGAQGPMQIMPATAEYLARRSGATSFTISDLENPSINIAYGSYYLRYLLDHYRGNEVEALAAYNGGIANVDRWVAAAHMAGGELTVAAIPFPETRAYAQRVLTAQREYRSTYATQLGYR